MSEEIPPPPETERTRAADRLAEMEKKWIQEWDGGHERARPAWHGQG